MTRQHIERLTMFLLWLSLPRTNALPASVGLLDPNLQPKFETLVPNPLDPSFLYDTVSSQDLEVSVGEGTAVTGLVDPNDGATPLLTTIWGYGQDGLYTWPGKTFEVRKDETIHITWHNRLPIQSGYLLTGKNNGDDGDFTDLSVIDTSFHWAYSIHEYQNYTIEKHGTPIVPHLHGGHTAAASDGNPEYFFTPEFAIKGPQWTNETYTYDNDQAATCIWYHDHALGITRLNVYAGMAGFYLIRDDQDTGKEDNPLKLPAFPYELPLVVQDRMFKESGELFYPSFKGDPFYSDFITDEGATVEDDDPTAMAEMFGDFMTVNGKIWPKKDVEPRNYRLRLLNGCDSRFLVIQLYAVPLGQTDFANSTAVPFHVIGGDHGFADVPTEVYSLVFEPSSRYDIIVNFTSFAGQRLILKNIGGDEPFGGDIPGPQLFDHTDRIMAFDVVYTYDVSVPDEYKPSETPVAAEKSAGEEAVVVNNRRRLGLFEGHDNLGRLQPLLGTIDPATDKDGNPICWPDDEAYRNFGLVGQMNGTATWSSPTTENIRLNDTEEWEIWNLSADAHPIHVHLVKFKLIDRKEIIFDSSAVDGEIEPENLDAVQGDGTYFTDMPMVLHDGSLGEGYHVVNPTEGNLVDPETLPEYIENFDKDVIVALPHQITTIRATFDKPGRYNWHCHILAHEDHEMMRVFHVGDLPEDQKGGNCSDLVANNFSEPDTTVSIESNADGSGAALRTFGFAVQLLAAVGFAGTLVSLVSSLY